MEVEESSFLHDQDIGEAEHSLCETIALMIQVLEQIDVVGTQLFQTLEKLAVEGEALRIKMKRQRNIPEPIKEAKKALGWSDGLAAAVRDYQAWCEGYRTDLERAQEVCEERLAAFHLFKEYADNHSSQ